MENQTNNNSSPQDAYNRAYGASVGASTPSNVQASANDTSFSPLTNRVSQQDSHASQVQSGTTSEIFQSSTPSTPAQSTQYPYSATQTTQQFSQSQTEVAATQGSHTSDNSVSSESVASTDTKQTAAAIAKKPESKVFVIGFIGALIACLLFFAVGSFTGLFGTTTVVGGSSSSSNSTQITATDEASGLAEQVSSKCLPSVVSVNVYGTSSSSSTSSLYDYLYGNGGSSNSTELTQTSTGSGVIISTDGYIITNQHVISGGQKFEVVIEGDTVEATLVGQDSSSDVAVLKVDTDKTLTAIEFADSDQITTGEWVMSIGNPFGLEQSVATGIVSATSRSQIIDSSSSSNSSSSSSGVTIYPNMIQTDAAINPGNSGGALVDKSGKLIGINTLITSYSGNYSGVGFAIPVNYAIGIAKNLIEGKNPTYAQLGVSLSTINSTYAQRFGFPVSEGAYVSEVSSGSGAQTAGIQKGDIITEFDGEKVTSASDLTLDVRKKNPGDTVTLKLYRGTQEMTVQVTLGEGQSTTSSNSNSNSGSGSSSGSQRNSGSGGSSAIG